MIENTTSGIINTTASLWINNTDVNKYFEEYGTLINPFRTQGYEIVKKVYDTLLRKMIF